MTKKDRPQLMILCEDKAHLDFITGYCLAAGWEDRGIILREFCPPGTQSAEQWVRERYERTVSTFRGKHGQGRNVVLLVMIDADNLAPADRRNQLEKNLPRVKGEPVAILVPKRNIQSWMAYLEGQFENEDRDHKHQFQKGWPIRKSGQSLRARCLAAQNDDFPASLSDACREWQERIRI